MNFFDALPFIVMLTIPVIAIIGGFTLGIIRTVSRQRLVELAQKERIAAIERGVDPAKLPPIVLPPGLRGKENGLTFEQKALGRSNGLIIGGLITFFFGVAMCIMIGVLEDEPGGWAPGLIFVSIGIALILSSRVGRPSPEDVRRSVEERREHHGGAV